MRRMYRPGPCGLVLLLQWAALGATGLGASAAWGADGAYVVDDAEVGAVGACKVESSASFADNRDFIGVVSPACVVDLGRPVELTGALARARSSGEWGTSFGLKAKTALTPIETGRVGLALSLGTVFDATRRQFNAAFATVPATVQLHETLRLNVNAGWLWNPSAGLHGATWGAGFEWNFVKPLTLIGEVFGIAGAGENRNPRAQAGLRYTPREDLDIDVIYGRNVTGLNAHWVTIGLNLRFEPRAK